MKLQEQISRIQSMMGVINEETTQWRTLTMDELFDYNNKDKDQKTFIKPKFPTRRWGNVYTKDSTTDIKIINNLLNKLKEDGYTVRKKLDKETNSGKFYRIEIKGDINEK
jgi:hypothetical protein